MLERVGGGGPGGYDILSLLGCEGGRLCCIELNTPPPFAFGEVAACGVSPALVCDGASA